MLQLIYLSPLNIKAQQNRKQANKICIEYEKYYNIETLYYSDFQYLNTQKN